MVEMTLPTRSLTSVLRVVRILIIRTLGHAGFPLREPDELQYRPRIEEGPERLLIDITAPVTGRIIGKWKDATSSTLMFTVSAMQCRLEEGQWPITLAESVPIPAEEFEALLSPASVGSPTAYGIQAGEEADATLPTQPADTNCTGHPARYERVIDL